MRPRQRKSLVVTAVAALVGASAAIEPATTQAQMDYPSKPIQVIVPYPAGGIVDIATRIVKEKVSKILGQPIIVENRPGANSNIGAELASRAAPDGYTWTYIGPATLANPRIYSGLRWSEKSFVGAGLMAWAPFAIVVNPGSPANTIAEFVALAKKEPGKLNYANSGIGSAVHMNSVIFMQHTKTEMLMIPYSGQPEALLDLMGDRTHFMVASIGLVSQHVQTKKLKALALIANRPSPRLPNVPTMVDAGYPAVNVVPWYGLGLPRDVPQPIVAKINAAINAALKDPEIKTQFEKHSLDVPEPMSVQQVADLIARDAEEFGRVVKAANIRINQ